MFFLFKSIGTPSSPMVGHFTGNSWKSQSFGSGTWGMPREERKKTALTVWLGLFGMSGDTELFEKPSNIKDLWAYEQRIILYIPYLGAAALKQPPFS